MWYEKEKKKDEIDFSKPIFAKKTGEETLVLLPQIKAVGSYKVFGFNWFKMHSGKYNSSAFFTTPKDAIKAYNQHKIFNGKLTYIS